MRRWGGRCSAFGWGMMISSNSLPRRGTFVFEKEAQAMQAMGMGKHLTPKELLVISPTGPMDNAFRWENECVRHKILDLIGDLYLVGRPIRGRLVAHKSGHELNHQLARRLVQQSETDAGQRWCIARRRWTSARSSGFCRTGIRCCWSIV